MKFKSIKIENKIITITHPDKILFPKDNITKWDLVKYYIKISDFILPFVKNHPITINCFREGINNNGFYRQHAPNNLPDWFQTYELERRKLGKMNHILCQNKASLIYLVNLNMVSIHRWLSTINNPEYPEILIVDIDPPQNMFDLACKAAKLIRIQLENLHYKAYLMVTGSRGLHVISKVNQNDSFEHVRNMLYKITSQIAYNYPQYFSIEVRKKNRENLVYLDITRNAYGQTAIAPFSVRAKEGAPIATPISWEEVDKKGLTPNKYNISNIISLITLKIILGMIAWSIKAKTTQNP
ncbi:non-homologous end-joining DNA ligase [Candidatus Jidaibacter acanthamoebae]|nr:non-homologous end-joining DNA ligase [Candidatus Jidaibacter acanthamoeba]